MYNRTNIKPQLAIVEKASIFFKSSWYAAAIEPPIAVEKPTNTKNSTLKKFIYKPLVSISIKKPAATKVAECISADAGTGAFIDSGSHIKVKIWTDFIIDATNSTDNNICIFSVLVRSSLLYVEVLST